MAGTLAHETVAAARTDPERWLYLLHGIYGAGRNWGTIARRVTRARPDWGFVLVDLRQHGASQGFPPPHTVAAAAEDVRSLARTIGLPGRAVLGHSFGGKVALELAASPPPELEQVWVVDSTPAARAPSGSAWRMLEVVRSLPPVFSSRDELVVALQEASYGRPIALWMATNLEHRDGAYHWRFDLDAIEELLRDFFRIDLWPVVESPPPGVELRFVKASESSVLNEDAIARIRAAGSRGAVELIELEGGHWINADNPEAVISLLEDGLSRG